MNPINEQLDRLLRAAARAPRPAEAPAPFVTEARVLAAWRESRRPAVSWASTETWRMGLATAMTAACVALCASWFASRHIDESANDPYVLNDPGLSVAMSTGWLP